MKPNHILILTISVSLAILSLSVSYVYASFNDTNSIPPANNTAGPINTSGSTQVKQGVLGSNAEVQAPVFRSNQNGGYYIHPIGSSRLNAIYADNVHSYGTMNANDYYIRSIGRWVSSLRNGDWASAGWFQYRNDGRTDGPWCKFLNEYTGNCSCPGGSYPLVYYADSTFNQWHTTVYCRFY